MKLLTATVPGKMLGLALHVSVHGVADPHVHDVHVPLPLEVGLALRLHVRDGPPSCRNTTVLPLSQIPAINARILLTAAT